MTQTTGTPDISFVAAGVAHVYVHGTLAGKVERGDYGAHGRGWAAIPIRHMGTANPVESVGCPVFRTRHEAAVALTNRVIL